MKRTVRRVKLNWKQLEDVLAGHLYAIRAIPESTEICEISLKKTMTKDDEYALLDLHVLERS